MTDEPTKPWVKALQKDLDRKNAPASRRAREQSPAVTAGSDDEPPEWILTRDAMIGDTMYPSGYRFSGSPTDRRVRPADIAPVNRSARGWSPTSHIIPRPRYRAAHGRRMMADGKLVHAGQDFFSDSWPEPDWEPLNSSAEEVVQHQREHAGEPRPTVAWAEDRVNTLAREEAREAERVRKAQPPAPPSWPFSNPMPPSARGFRPRDVS